MKSLLAALFVLGFAIATVHAQSDADETYLGIYNLIQQGDTAAANGQAQTAIDDYVSARNSLTVLHNGYPDWNPRIVLFRQKYLNERIDALHAENPNTVIQPVPAPAAAGNAAAAKPAETVLPAVTPAPAANGAPADWADQLASLRTQLQNAHSDNDTLSAKLKEALAARPAALGAGCEPLRSAGLEHLGIGGPGIHISINMGGPGIRLSTSSYVNAGT